MKYVNLSLDEERALYGIDGGEVINCRFDGPADGESALKEASNLKIDACYFNLRYPFWHTRDAIVRDSRLTENCRAALWYDENISLVNCRMDGIKALRECRDTRLHGCEIHSPEFAWRCREMRVNDCRLESEYPFFECSDLRIERLNMKGKYSFQYVENATLKNCILDTKDAFWHSKNVTVYDSVVRGEYLGWYSERLRLVRCRIIGTQPLCYCKGLVIEDCTMENTDLAFERSEVSATVRGGIESVKNPLSGCITADGVGEVIFDHPSIDPSATKIETKSACVCA